MNLWSGQSVTSRTFLTAVGVLGTSATRGGRRHACRQIRMRLSVVCLSAIEFVVSPEVEETQSANHGTAFDLRQRPEVTRVIVCCETALTQETRNQARHLSGAFDPARDSDLDGPRRPLNRRPHPGGVLGFPVSKQASRFLVSNIHVDVSVGPGTAASRQKPVEHGNSVRPPAQRKHEDGTHKRRVRAALRILRTVTQWLGMTGPGRAREIALGSPWRAAVGREGRHVTTSPMPGLPSDPTRGWKDYLPKVYS